MKKSSTKGALYTSFIALVLCCTMLLGTTFAWFTDEVTSTNNIIQSGSLDVEFEYSTDMSTWDKVEPTTNIFKKDALWEPGYAEVVYFKVTNVGDLALKYQLGVSIANEKEGTNKAGESFKLSDYIEYGVVPGVTEDYADRALAIAAVAEPVKLNKDIMLEDSIIAKTATTPAVEKTYALVVYMPEEVGNDANHKVGDDAAYKPEINLGIKVFATQLNAESDSFDENYDKEAPKLTIEVTPENIQEYLDGKYGTLENITLKLTAGNYGVLNIGRPTKYAGNNSEYYCGTHDFTTDDAAAFRAHLGDDVSLLANEYHTTPKYTTTLKDLTIEGAEGATVAGVLASTGHSYGDVYDYVRDIDYDSGSAYYSTLSMKNVTFKNVAFTGQVNINTSDADTVIDGVAFDGCSFTTGGTASSNGAAIRYYNEANNGKVRNITVKDSTFTNCYQGVYIHNSNGATITGNTFDTTGHNAIALQSGPAGAVDLKNVVIKNNIFKNIADRVIRMGDVGADTNITMEYNVATNSGDEDGEVIRANTIAEGITVNVNYNSWGGTVVNPELCDVKTGTLASDTDSFKNAITDSNSDNVIIMDDIAIDEIGQFDFSIMGYKGISGGMTINGNGNSIIRDTASNSALMISTTEKVIFEDVVFESTKGSAVLETRTVGANIEVNDCVFRNNSSPSTGNTGVQVYAENVTMTFNRCTFNNMPIITNSSFPKGIKLIFNECTFNWEGDNCPGFIQLANYIEAEIDLTGCAMNYTTNSQYTTAKTMIDCRSSVGTSTINFNGLKVNGTRNNENIWKICSNCKNLTINTTGELSYTFNGENIDFATYLK